MNERVQAILTDLERVRAHLQGLSDDVWLRIDRDDDDSMDAGVKHVRTISEMKTQLGAIANSVTAIGQAYEAQATRPTTNDDGTSRVRVELDRTHPHTLDEDFLYTTPFGFTLQGKEHRYIPTWNKLFERFCQELAANDPDLFQRLPSNPDYYSKFGNRLFATEPTHQRRTMKIVDGIYAEGNYSANDFRNHMRRLLSTFGIEESELTIYLRDRSVPTNGH